MLRPTKLSLGIAVLLFAPLAVAQSKLGELLDAGAKKLSPEEFKEEVVQRIVTGPTASGGALEVMYTRIGTIQGRGSAIDNRFLTLPLSGEWRIDDEGRICTSIRAGFQTGVAGAVVNLPPRCQPWFKLKERYFLSDSDTDRQARVLVRTVKQ